MHRLAAALIAVVAAIAGTQAARAADMPVKAPAARVAPSYNWNGFYIGGHAGYGLGVAKTSAPVDTDFFGGSGFLGGVLAGYNYMITPRVLLGIEGDFELVGPCLFRDGNRWGRQRHHGELDAKASLFAACALRLSGGAGDASLRHRRLVLGTIQIFAWRQQHRHRLRHAMV